jgi:hypothetical protein
MLMNSAGGSAADPILNGLGGQWVIGASTMDVATFVDAWIDTANATIPGTTSVKASLSPAATVITAGTNAAWTNASSQLTIASTTGITAGDFLYLSHGSITAGFYQIATVVNGTTVTLSSSINGSNLTNISYQVAWRYDFTFGSNNTVSSGAGQINYFKARLQDSLSNNGDLVDSAYIRNAPSGTSYISINGVDPTSGSPSLNTASLNLSVLSGWTNRGGVSHIALANHSVQSVNNFTWLDSSTGDKTYAYANTNGNLVTSGSGVKYGRLLLKSKAAAAVSVGVDFSLTIDTSGPTVVFALNGR